MREISAPEHLDEWIATSKPGASCEYYRGLLMRDRAFIDPSKPMPYELTIARRMWALQVAGRVALVQRRHGDFDYSYRAQKIV